MFWHLNSLSKTITFATFQDKSMSLHAWTKIKFCCIHRSNSFISNHQTVCNLHAISVYTSLVNQYNWESQITWYILNFCAPLRWYSIRDVFAVRISNLIRLNSRLWSIFFLNTAVNASSTIFYTVTVAKLWHQFYA